MNIHPIYTAPASDRIDPQDEPMIKVVETEDERFKAMVIRAIVYMHEQQCPFSEEFDLNDHAATQIIGMCAHGEPIMTARVRYFSSFVKVERFAIRIEYRGRGYAHRLLRFLLTLRQQKGFSRFYLHAQQRLQQFYEGYGFRIVGGDFAFSDHEYVEMVLDIATQPRDPAEHIGQQPMWLNRPENSFHRAGPLERRGGLNAVGHAFTKEDA